MAAVRLFNVLKDQLADFLERYQSGVHGDHKLVERCGTLRILEQCR
jgi:hypothetical protein